MNSKKTAKTGSLARLLLTVFVPMLSVMTIIALATTSIIPAKYFWPVSLVWVALSLLTAFGILRSGKDRLVRTILSALGALVITASNVIAIVHAAGFNSFMGNIVDTPEKTERYSLIVLKDNSTTFNKTASTTVGYLSTDPYSSDVDTYISSELGATPIVSPDPTSLSLSVSDGSILSALINDATLSLYETNLEDFYGSVYIYATYDIPVTQKSVAEKKSIDGPFILYVSGIDVRSSSLPLSARSDVNILIVVNPKSHKNLTVNIPRDYYVDLATSGAKDKLTHAGVYGVDESRQTLANLFNVPIDYYARVNFNTLVKVVDTIGGIDVESETEFKAYNGQTFVKGINHLNGSSALAFARERKVFVGGDRVRGQHQQVVIEAIFEKILRPETLVNANSILGTLGDSFQTNLDTGSLRSIIYDQLDTMSKWSFENIAVDGTGDMQPTYSMGAQKLYVMWPDETSVAYARAKIFQTLSN